MTRLWNRIPMSLRAALWALLVTLSLLLLWSSLDFAVPSPVLAIRMAERQNLFGPGQIAASGDIELGEGFRPLFNQEGRWYVVRDGDYAATVVLRRVWDHLWTAEDRDHSMSIALLSEDTLLSSAWVSYGYASDASSQTSSDISQQLVSICAYNDRFARIEATMTPSAPHDLTPEEQAVWESEHTAAATAIPAGDRVWTALITMDVGSGFNSLVHLRGYDARGNLIYESPTA